ncbi:MAG: hypothetical protein QGI83_05735, partial [Candidatus Latescibacteria bacterium]|nr:hypothetical protein [Candidatus Latescibacterota bacterium]
MPGQIVTVGVVVALLLPWTVLSVTGFRDGSLSQRIILGIVGGLAATVTLGYLLAMAGMLHGFHYPYGLAVLAAVASAVGHLRRSRASQGNDSGDKARCPRPSSNGADAWFVVSILAIAIAYAIPTLSTDAPIGWDPSFHAILAKKILDTGALATDWRPFEEIGVNYPLGMHIFIALASAWSGQQVHQTFQSLHMVIQIPAAVLIYLLSLRVFADRKAAALAMLAYALLCNFGSFISYYQWGGLPTEIAFLLFLGLIWSCLSTEGWKHRSYEVLLFGSLILVHHLSALIVAAVLAFYVVMKGVDRSLDDLSKRILWLFGLTFLAYAFFIIPYALRSSQLAGTHTLRFTDEPLIPFWDVVRSLGVAATVLGVLGLVLSLRRAAETSGTFLLCWFTSLVLAFCLLGYVYRFVANIFFGEDFTAFTPSRFYTVLSYPLAIYAGYALAVIATRIQGLFHRWMNPRLAEGIALAVLTAAILAAAVPHIHALSGRRAFAPSAPQLASHIKAKTPKNAFVIYRQPIGPRAWVPYLTWRPTIYTPIPASEDRKAIAEKTEFFSTAHDLDQIRPWLEQRGLQGYLFSREA